MHLPSASELQRAMACRGSMTLPRIEESNEYAAKGVEVHKFLANIVKGMSFEAALAKVPGEYVSDCKEIDIDDLPRDLTNVQTEVAYAYNPFTGVGRVLGVDVERDYTSADRLLEFVGTADIVGVKADGTLYIGDFKTGAAFNVPSSDKNWQLFLLALAATRAGGHDQAEVSIIRTLGTVRNDKYLVDALELAAAAESLFELAQWHKEFKEKKDRSAITFATGDHCKYCPSKLYCPAKTAILKSVINMPHNTKDSILEMLTEANAAQAYIRWQEVKSVMRMVEPALRQYASDKPIKLPNGKTFGPRDTESKEINPDVARAVLKELYGDKVADAACSFETTKKAIKNSLREVAQKGELGKTEREVFEKIRQGGGVITVNKRIIDEH